MSIKPQHELKAEHQKLLRGAILSAAHQMFPQGLMKSTITYLADTFGVTEHELDREIGYLRVRGWIATEPIQVLGRPNMKITLTAAGYDIASNIDPANPVFPE